MLDYKSALILLIVLVTLGAIVFLIDAILFIRWISYRWAVYDIEERAAHEAVERAGSAPSSSVEEAVSGAPSAVVLPEPPFSRTWSLVDAFLGFQLVFIVSQLVITLATLPALFWHGHFRGDAALVSPGAIVVQSVGLFFMNALFVGVTAFYLRRYGLSLAQIGLRRPSGKQISLGVGVGAALFVCATGLEVALDGILSHFLPKPVLDGLVAFNKAVTAGGLFEKLPTLQLKLALALAGAIAAPIGEEVFFRGLLYNSLKRRLNVPLAMVISGMLFALIHFGPLSILVIFPMGMLLAYVYERTQSLWVTITIHSMNNTLAFVTALAFPHFGEAPRSPIKPAAPPPKRITMRSVTISGRPPGACSLPRGMTHG